jgi:hypothetical protein
MPRKLEKVNRDEIFVVGSFIALLGFIMKAASASILDVPALTFYAVILVAVLHGIAAGRMTAADYRPEHLFLRKKPVRFVPYRRPGRARRR